MSCRRKSRSSHTKQPLANADIKVTDASGKVFFDGKTGTDGYINMTELPAGRYTWHEVIAPEAYSIDPALDNDWWELPAMIAGALLLLGGAAFLVIKRRKKLRGSEK